jgi:hypothetical protein
VSWPSDRSRHHPLVSNGLSGLLPSRGGPRKIWRERSTSKPVSQSGACLPDSRSIGKIFMDVCQILDLEWREIASNPPEDFPDPNELSEPILSELDAPDIDGLVAAGAIAAPTTPFSSGAAFCNCSTFITRSIWMTSTSMSIFWRRLASQQWGDLTTLNDLDPHRV